MTDASGVKVAVNDERPWLGNMVDFAETNGISEEWLEGIKTPARATGKVKSASVDYKIKIVAIAAL